jgi:hypothetical protein
MANKKILKKLWETVLKEFLRLSEYDNCVFICHVIENIEENPEVSITFEQQELLKQDLYSRPEKEYDPQLVRGFIDKVREHRSCLWKSRDNESRINFIKNRIKQLS